MSENRPNNEEETSKDSPLENSKKNEDRPGTREDNQDISSEVTKLQHQSSNQVKSPNLSELPKDLSFKDLTLKESEDRPSLIEDVQERSSKVLELKNRGTNEDKTSNLCEIHLTSQEHISKDSPLDGSSLKENEDISQLTEDDQDISSEVTKLQHQSSNQEKSTNLNESDHNNVRHSPKDPALEASTLKDNEDTSPLVIEDDQFRNTECMELQPLSSNQGKSSSTLIESKQENAENFSTKALAINVMLFPL